MKVDNLLALYLYQHKELSLPGIGSFTMDENAVLPDENAKVKPILEGIHFSSKTAPVYTDALIDFIKAKTGKMKALAIADLDSYTLLAQQFLNIGKPFLIEGIGTLLKTQEGHFEFSAGTPVNVRLEEPTNSKQGDNKRKSVFMEELKESSSSGAGRKGVLVLGVLLTLALVVWGGYYLYNKNAGDTSIATNIAAETTTTISNTTDTLNTLPDTTQTIVVKTDTVTTTIAPPTTPTSANTVAVANGSFKVVLWTSRNKALLQTQVDKTSGKVKLGQKDSTRYFLYIPFTGAATDTTRVRDSVKLWFWGNRDMKVYVTQ
ncbi:MAG: hypothetical protein RLZZ316_1951 [Bacteroidota bacterium]